MDIGKTTLKIHLPVLLEGKLQFLQANTNNDFSFYLKFRKNIHICQIKKKKEKSDGNGKSFHAEKGYYKQWRLKVTSLIILFKGTSQTLCKNGTTFSNLNITANTFSSHLYVIISLRNSSATDSPHAYTFIWEFLLACWLQFSVL